MQVGKMNQVRWRKEISALISHLLNPKKEGFPKNASVLYLPTGPIQEIAMANGWHEEYMKLSQGYDGLKYLLEEKESGKMKVFDLSEEIFDWLMKGDPSIRWQALQDIKKAAPEIVMRERKKVAEEGWGAKLLSLQDPSGLWAGGTVWTQMEVYDVYDAIAASNGTLPRKSTGQESLPTPS